MMLHDSVIVSAASASSYEQSSKSLANAADTMTETGLIIHFLRRRVISIGLVMIALSGCAVGPNFHHPHSPSTKRYTDRAMPTATDSAKTIAGKKQYFRNGEDIPLKWWTVFHSPALNQLIKDSISANPDIEAASASLKMAHETTLVQRAAFFPILTGSYNPSRELTSGVLSSNLASNAFLYTLNTSSLSISYVPDVFGLTRRQLESAVAQEEMAAFQSEAVYLTLTSNVVLAAIQEAAIRAQLKVAKHSIHLAREFLHVMQRQQELGAISEASVAAQDVLLAQTESILPPLQLQLAQQRHLIASLRGHLTSDATPQTFTLTDFTLPDALPVKLPSKLVEQRPDIRAAEAQMHAASAQIGVSIANRLPNVLLTGNGGYMPVDFSAKSVPAFLPILPAGPSLFWDIMGNLAGTIFDAGALMHQQRAAEESYTLSVAQYRRVVLNAFEHVADSLKSVQFDAKSLKLALAQERASSRNFMITKKRLEFGQASYFEVLNAEQSYQQALANLAINQAKRLTDTVALFQALGGGWRGCGPLLHNSTVEKS
ncbi:MAG: efflux transporter outer membrane subunit [Legionellaceae bacterium]|nr:efflux transporter outer membrane subunit [Legionellaceae bacterium]